MRSAAEVEAVDLLVVGSPAHGAKLNRKLHLLFLGSIPAAPDIEVLAEFRSPSERFQLTDRVFCLHAPKGLGRSRVAVRAVKLPGVVVAARNWRTVQTLGDGESHVKLASEFPRLAQRQYLFRVLLVSSPSDTMAPCGAAKWRFRRHMV